MYRPTRPISRAFILALAILALLGATCGRASASEVAWSTYVGGNNYDYCNALAVDAAGNILATGNTYSSGWVSGGLDTSYNGGYDVFAVKTSPTGQMLWSTYLGGSSDDYGQGIAVDGAGNAFVTGYTYSPGWVNAGFDTTFNGNADAFAVKLSPSGAHLWSTYLGGSNSDYGYGIAVDAAGAPAVTGYTTSSGWTSGGFSTAYHGEADTFVVKLSATGQHLWSTSLGGVSDDIGYAIAADKAGNFCVTGVTQSNGWVSGGYKTTLTGYHEAFAVKLSSAGGHLWSTYLGGSNPNSYYYYNNTYGQGIAVDSANNLYLTGYTQVQGWVSGGFNTTLNGTGYSGIDDAFVVRLAPDGRHLWSTYLGGNSSDYGRSITVDAADHIFVAGDTQSSNWTAGGFNIQYRYYDGFVAMLTPAGKLGWSSYLGGSSEDHARGVAVDKSGNLIVAGYTYSNDWIAGGYDTSLSGYTDGFIARITHADRASTGSLRLTLNPPQAVAAGARWRVVGASAWNNSGAVAGGIPAGNPTIEFSAVPYWLPPGPQVVPVPVGGVAQAAATYTAAGALRVLIYPPDAAAAGAQWRRSGTTLWHDANTSEPAVLPGHYTIEFKPTPEWLTPPSAAALVQAGQMTEVTGIYRQPKADLSWTATLGGPYEDEAAAVAVDGAGNTVVAGSTSSAGWVSPGAPGADGTYNGGNSDAFVTLLNSFGEPVWSTCLGGANTDVTTGVAFDGAGNIIVAGTSWSQDWIAGGLDARLDGPSDAFVARLSPAGVPLWSRFLGGVDAENCGGIAVDKSNNIYVTGDTSSPDWLTGGANEQYGGAIDGFVVKLSSVGKQLWGTYLGSQSYGETRGEALVVMPNSKIAVTGYSDAISGFISGAGATILGGGFDAFVVQLNSDGDQKWSSWLGGLNDDFGSAIAADGANNLYVAGTTYSPNWLTGGDDTTLAGPSDAFAVKLDRNGKTLWGTYLGGSADDDGCGIASDSAGNVFVTGATGTTYSTGWIKDGFDESYHGQSDNFVARLTPGGQRVWSTTLGGSGADVGRAIAIAGAGQVCVAGASNSDAFVARIKDMSQDARRGKLALVIVPPQAVTDGAQWRRTGATLWRDSGASAAIPPGPCAVEFKSISNWTEPFRISATVLDGQVTTLTATYIHHAGSLMVTLTPPAAAAAGAKWRRVGTSAWRDSGTTETAVPTGTYSVEFRDAATWVTPSVALVSVAKDQVATLSINYTRAYGSLQVTITPPEAAAAGARWRRVGTTTWRSSGSVESGIVVGNYSVEFNTLGGIWRTPSPLAATVAYNQTATAVGAYGYDSGTLIVNITPPEAVADGAHWRRAGTATWRASGTRELAVPLGTYQVEFNTPTGWTSPPAQSVTIQSGETIRAAGAYTRPGGGISWGTYIGGYGYDSCNGVAVDAAGNIFACGQTESAGWTFGGTETAYNAGADGFVVKYNSQGQHLWSTYLGGSGQDSAFRVAVDSQGDCVVTGYTGSPRWVWGGYNVYHAGSYDAFVVKLNPSGQHLWSTYLGGIDKDYGRAVTVDKDDNILVAGNTLSSNSLTTGWIQGGYNTTYGGATGSYDWDGVYGGDAFVIKLAPTGGYLWGTYLGGRGDEYCRGIAVDSKGNPCIVGSTSSQGWVSGGDQTTLGGQINAFAAKLSSTGQHLWSTCLGGNDRDMGYGIAVNGADDLYVVGTTTSPGWISGDYNINYDGDKSDGFVVKLSSAGKRLWSSYIGGSGEDYGVGIAVDAAGNAFVTGSTESNGWVAGGQNLNLVGGQDAFLVKISPLGQHLWSSFLGGGTWTDGSGNAVALAANGDILVGGFTYAGGWLSGGYDTTNDGGNDGFLVRLHDGTPKSYGSLRVNFTPDAAATAGGQWRIAGQGAWRSSRDTMLCVNPGTYPLEFKDISAGWYTPARISVTVQQGKTAIASVAYKSRLTVQVQGSLVLHAAPGDSTLFPVVASGLLPITYQWKKDGVPIPGAVGTTYYIASATLADAGYYTCQVRNAGAAAESTPIRFVVHDGTPILMYLLGYATDPTGLDMNGDTKIDVADLMLAAKRTPPQAPANPTPADGAIGVARQPTLDWGNGVNATAYDLYVWAPAITTRPATPLVSGLTASAGELPITLNPATTYHWQVVAHGLDQAVATSGPVWTFTTGIP